MTKEIEETPVDTNPAIITYKKNDTMLMIETTHAIPVIKTESHSIEAAQKQIAKFDDVIAIWTAKKKPYQDIIDKYNEIV